MSPNKEFQSCCYLVLVAVLVFCQLIAGVSGQTGERVSRLGWHFPRPTNEVSQAGGPCNQNKGQMQTYEQRQLCAYSLAQCISDTLGNILRMRRPFGSEACCAIDLLFFLCPYKPPPSTTRRPSRRTRTPITIRPLNNRASRTPRPYMTGKPSTESAILPPSLPYDDSNPANEPTRRGTSKRPPRTTRKPDSRQTTTTEVPKQEDTDKPPRTVRPASKKPASRRPTMATTTTTTTSTTTEAPEEEPITTRRPSTRRPAGRRTTKGTTTTTTSTTTEAPQEETIEPPQEETIEPPQDESTEPPDYEQQRETTTTSTERPSIDNPSPVKPASMRSTSKRPATPPPDDSSVDYPEPTAPPTIEYDG